MGPPKLPANSAGSFARRSGCWTNDNEHFLDAITEFTHQQLLRVFMPFALADAACGPEPFEDLAILTNNRNGSRISPPSVPSTRMTVCLNSNGLPARPLH
jgi:hypothetical protein